MRVHRACRAWTSFLCRRKTKSGPNGANSPTIIPEKRRMTLMQRLASVGIGPQDGGRCAPDGDDAARHSTYAAIRASATASDGAPAGRPAGRAGIGICPPGGSTGSRPPWPAQPLCIIRRRTINSTSRPSCAVRRTEGRPNTGDPAFRDESGVVHRQCVYLL